MSYTNPDTMVEVANILESFDEENLREIFKAQIIDNEGYTDMQINHLTPLYSSYQRVMNIGDIDELKFKRTSIPIAVKSIEKISLTV